MIRRWLTTSNWTTKILLIVLALGAWTAAVVTVTARDPEDYSYEIHRLESQIEHLEASISDLQSEQPSPTVPPRARVRPEHTHDDIEIAVSSLRRELGLVASEVSEVKSDVSSVRAEFESKLRRMELDAALRR